MPDSASPDGVQDMAGNVWQWTATVYAPMPYYTDDGREDAGQSGNRVVRGGSWHSWPEQLQSTYRISFPPERADPAIGFRCAWAPTDEATYVSRGGELQLKVPAHWVVVDQYQRDHLNRKHLIDLVGFVEGPLDVAITIRTVPSEGDTLDEFLADYLESGHNKPYEQKLFHYSDQLYYLVDRPTGKVDLGAPDVVGGLAAVSLMFQPSVALPGNAFQIAPNLEVREVIVKRGNDFYLFTLEGVKSEYPRDERILEAVLRSIKWAAPH